MRQGLCLSICLLALTGSAAEHYTEFFSYNRPFDLEGASLTFTREDSDNYSIQGSVISELPVDPTDHPSVYLADDTFIPVTLSPKTFPFYHLNSSTAFVGSNGYITFSQGDTEWGVSVSNHFSLARISTLYDDWHDTEGDSSLRIITLEDRLVVTFLDIPEFGASNDNRATFQTELFFNDGTIRMSWMNVDNPNPQAIVGLSRGAGIPSGYTTADLSFIIKDWDNDGMPDAWEERHFGSRQNCIATNNYDNDALDNLSEYICGSDPRDKNSGFKATIKDSALGPIIEWRALDGRRYSISKTENLNINFQQPYKSGLLFPQNAYTDTVGSVSGFYQVHVEMDQ